MTLTKKTLISSIKQYYKMYRVYPNRIVCDIEDFRLFHRLNPEFGNNLTIFIHIIDLARRKDICTILSIEEEQELSKKGIYFDETNDILNLTFTIIKCDNWLIYKE